MCLFCDIAAGDTDAEIVYSDETSVGFLDFRPLFPGHTLVIPRVHVETLWELPGDLVRPYFEACQLLSRAMVEVLGATGAFVASNNRVSQSVPHLHFHVVPRRPKDGLRGFFWPRSTYDGDEMAATARKLRAGIEALSAAK